MLRTVQGDDIQVRWFEFGELDVVILSIAVMFEDGIFKVCSKPLSSSITIKMKSVARNAEIFGKVIIFKPGFLKCYEVTLEE